MKVIILAAGLGTRHRPNTDFMPKCLIPISGKPYLEWILDWLGPMDFSNICIVVGRFGLLVESYVNEVYPWLDVGYVYQPVPLGTADAVGLALADLKYCSEPVLVVNGDFVPHGLGLVDSRVLFSVSDEQKPLFSVLSIRESDMPSTGGCVDISYSGGVCWVRGFDEKPDNPKSNIILSGFFFIRNAEILLDAVSMVLRYGIKVKGEYQLSSAFQYMYGEGHEFVGLFCDDTGEVFL